MRASLADEGLPDARTVSSMRNGVTVRYVGLVICRQRPGTAGRIPFMTLEDKTSFNVILFWPGR
jgi:error-prone DNA polymerase